MAGKTQKQPKWSYFHSGPFWKGKYQKQSKGFKVENIKCYLLTMDR